MRMGVLHCGHSTTDFPGLPGLGLSTSDTQSSRHVSCACSLHAQGDRHCDDVDVSSVSFCRQIQHFLGSALDGVVWGFGLEGCCCFWVSGLGDGFRDDSVEDG